MSASIDLESITLLIEMKVLLIDDSDHIRSALKRLLESGQGVEIVGEAVDADEAVILIADLQPDVIISDFNLENSTALDVFMELRQHQWKPVVIVLTNSSSQEVKMACLKAGADYFLDKSTQFHRVTDLLEEIEGKEN